MDLAAAANWFRLAADAGLPEAEYNLGVMYERGEGVETDLKEAKSLFERAAEAGLVDAVEKLKVFV
ncbi:Sel1 repeat protein [Obelidium mucronatum]|nr:Sel1 repeat protein [Obelidium mucronatum]